MTTHVPPDLLQTPFRKNVIINGNLDIWQRGTSYPAVATGAYTADRFNFSFSGGMIHSVSASADVPTFAESGIRSPVSLLCNVTTADTSITGAEYTSIQYTIEGYDYAQLADGNATLSFWVKGTKTGTHCIAFRNAGADRSYVVEYTIDVTDTWEKKIITVPLTETGGTWDYINGKGLTIFFTIAAGPTLHTTANTWQTGNFIATSNQVNGVDSTANNFRIAQVQFEKGAVATDFERRPYAEELALCYRYYEKHDATDGATTALLYQADCTSTVGYTARVPFSVVKRATPTLTMGQQNSTGFPASPGSTLANTKGLSETRICNGTGTARFFSSYWIADAEL